MHNMENGRINFTTTGGFSFLGLRSYSLVQQSFLKTFLLKIAFIWRSWYLKDAHLSNAMMYYGNAFVPRDWWCNITTYGADVLLHLVNAPIGCTFAMMQYADEMTHALINDAYGVMHLSWCPLNNDNVHGYVFGVHMGIWCTCCNAG